jgi:hypothetical protein
MLSERFLPVFAEQSIVILGRTQKFSKIHIGTFVQALKAPQVT